MLAAKKKKDRKSTSLENKKANIMKIKKPTS
jgi:hypothetical protein